MNRSTSFLTILAILFCVPSFSQSFTRADSLRGYLYPWRASYDVTFYGLDIWIEPDSQAIHGSVIMEFDAVTAIDSLQIDLYRNMQIDQIKYEGQPLPFRREYNAVFLHFPETLPAGTHHQITTYYHGTPQRAVNAPWDGGFVWTKDKKERPWIGVACEGDGASLWWPCKDHLSDEPDSATIALTAPDPLVGVSNGRLMGKEPVAEGYTKWRWKVTNPINTYNITANAGYYVHFYDTYDSEAGLLDLDYYVIDYNLDKAKKTFAQVKPMMDCFEKHFGAYPFTEDSYKLVEAPYLGMEHQSAIAYGNEYLPGYHGMDFSNTGWDYIIVHESGHEWFGNSLSSSDIAEAWIHESFTTYSEAVYLECLEGYEAALDYMHRQGMFLTNRKPIIGPRDVNYADWSEDTDLYYKGAWMLQTIRYILDDDDQWFKMLRAFSLHFRHSVLTTADVVDYFNTQSGKDLTPVFNQFLRQAALPKLMIRQERVNKKSIILHYRWKAVPGFNLPVDITGKKPMRLFPTADWHQVEIPLRKGEEIPISHRYALFDVGFQ